MLILAFSQQAMAQTMMEQAREHWKNSRYHAATDIFRPLAAGGNPAAQFYMGEATRLGLGSEVNLENAVIWYTMAINQGFPPAENTMAVWLLEKESKNIAIVRLLIRAARKGYPPAQYNLCRLYSLGEHIEKNNERAVWWCRMAAEQGHREAIQALILALEHGIGTEQDKEEAQKWRQLQ